MQQSSVIAAALIIGFIVFVTARGELPKYLQVFGISPSPNVGAANAVSGVQTAKQGILSGLGL